MNPLRIVHKNKKAIKKDQETEFVKYCREMLEEERKRMKKVAEKKYGVNLDHVKFPKP